jgi:LPXTG-site transpeptidase (sortase) family protein
VKSKLKHSTFSLRQFNNFLSIIVVGVALYILLWPFLPQLLWWLKHEAPIVSSPVVRTVKAEPVPASNTLVIPKIDLRLPILDGPTTATADHGLWRRPLTATPPAGGNTVIAGHRFTYRGASFFYNLDKVALGDSIRIYWEGKTYNYKVTTIKTVLPSDAAVEAPSNQRMLTLYTCTPLWTSKYRLVIQALPEENQAQ